MELLSQEKRRVWIEDHPESAYAPGRVEEAREDGTFIVVDDEGGSFTVQASKALTVDPACLTGVDDLLMLNDFNEAALLHNIRVRYREDKIYTGVGSPILISVNPYANIAGLYSSTRQREYRKAGAAAASGHELGLPPHLYSVADAAYRTMLNESASQSIIISGESGAGKTEATKRILAFLADMQRHDGQSQQADKRSIEAQVLDANPVLEAFGNAKTVRNDNSSRFGKFVEVEFDTSGKLLSAQISNYLLEKCRIVTQQPEERNYHIFYQLIAGVSKTPELASRLQLGSASEFEYTQATDTIPGVDDVEEFNAMVDCMVNLGFTAEERVTVFSIVAAILHLGNLSFTFCAREGQDGVQIADESQAVLISDLLGIETSQLHNVLEHRTLEDRLTKKVIFSAQDEKSANYTRHSMAKVAYARLFDWLVWRINQSMSGQSKAKKDTRRIGLLDIYGFEVFEWNSFEQLCINFANEKLQHHFNSHMFTLEQGLYTREGISWSHITFQDNQHIIDALEKRPVGLFCLVDSECVMPSATDMTLLSKIYNTFKSSKIIYKPSRFASTDFGVAHYAGEVTYSVETFVEKNTDKLHVDIVNTFKSSKLELLKTLFTDPKFTSDPSSAKGGDKDRSKLRRSRSSVSNQESSSGQRANVTVSMVFREQLDKLVEDLNKTNPRYIRCIKPNAHKTAKEFDSKDVLRQLRCAGMLESIRIRHAGYAVRRPFKEFFQRFRLLAPHLIATGADPDYRMYCEKLMIEVEQRLRNSGVTLPEKSWQMGQTRVFMKDEVERNCERLLVDRSKRYVILLQTRWRGYKQRRKYKDMLSAARAAQAVFRTHLAIQKFAEAKRLRGAVLGLQAGLRSLRLRADFLRSRRAATTLQRYAKGWWCRKRIGQIHGKLAAARLERLREEEARKVELAQARRDAQEQKEAMEALQREMQANQAANEKQELLQLKEQNEELLARAIAAEQEAAAKNAQVAAATEAAGTIAESSAESAELQRRNEILEGRKEELQRRIEELQEELRKALDGKMEAERQCLDLRRQLREMPTEVSPQGGASAALDSLRSEIRSRIGDGPAASHGAAPIVPPLNLTQLEAGHHEEPTEGRKTIVCQQEIFEKLKQQFTEALGSGQDDNDNDDIVGFSLANSGEDKRAQQLEEEIRRLRRENAALRTEKLSLDDEVCEKANEASSLLSRVSNLTAELQAAKYRHEDETANLSGQLHDSIGKFRQQTEEMARLTTRLQDSESTSATVQLKVKKAEDEKRGLQEQIAQLQKAQVEMHHQLHTLQQERVTAVDQLSATRRGEQEWLQERELLREEINRMNSEAKSRTGELAQAKRTIEELANTRVPAEDVKAWKSRAEMYEREYHSAIRQYQEMSSAVAHMTQASFERGGELGALQEHTMSLQQVTWQKDQELKRILMEKQEMQKQLENYKVAVDYHQGKYKVLQGELSQSRALAERDRENEDLRAQLAALKQSMGASPHRTAAAGLQGTAATVVPPPTVGVVPSPVASMGSCSCFSGNSPQAAAPPSMADLGMQAPQPQSQPSPPQAAGPLQPPIQLGSSLQEEPRRPEVAIAQPKRKAAATYPSAGLESTFRPELLQMAEAEDRRRQQNPVQETLPLNGRESLLTQLNLNARGGFNKKLGSLSEEQ